MKIYTKTGDAGETSLFSGQRISKTHLRLHVYGTLDEMNAHLGFARTRNGKIYLEQLLARLQTLTFILCSDLATPFPAAGEPDRVDRVDARHIRYVEQCIDNLTAEMPPLNRFILPGGADVAAILHVARTVCRRAERYLVELSRQDELGPYVPKLVNRYSDYLFTLARYANHAAGRPDEILSREFPELNGL